MHERRNDIAEVHLVACLWLIISGEASVACTFEYGKCSVCVLCSFYNCFMAMAISEVFLSLGGTSHDPSYVERTIVILDLPSE